MKLHEYQSKRIFAKYGVPIPNGEVATTPAEAREIAQKLGGSVVVKSQVLVGGRGKAGGVKVAKDADEAEAIAGQILGMDIKGLTVEKVLIDETADIKDEIYLGIVIDRAQQKPVIIASAEGGVEIEVVAKENPDAIKRVAVDPVFGLLSFQATNLAYDLGLKRAFVGQF
ncbi:MAG: acetate--CoA ligase family protein, partial [Anaerolineae bacterium]|nr:acetate--CoA ligase family protein [Anaerolineae bacterium]